ncbi:hypothetical protein H0H87_001261 [Tephrocybe sp. NHM501043]|nr:hypothetical protein H0H87_001261 [Tephrocybe sp. NHM501043]
MKHTMADLLNPTPAPAPAPAPPVARPIRSRYVLLSSVPRLICPAAARKVATHDTGVGEGHAHS